MNKKKILIIVGIIVAIALVLTIVLLVFKKKNSEKTVDYVKIIDDEVGYDVSGYLELDQSVYLNADNYELLYKIKNGSETEVSCILDENVRKMDISDLEYNWYSFSKLGHIEEKDIVAGYVIMREGKVYDSEGFRAKTVEVVIYVVNINGEQYVYVLA